MQMAKNGIQLSCSAVIFISLKITIVGLFQISFCIIQLHKANFYSTFIKKSMTWIFPIKKAFTGALPPATAKFKVKQGKTKRYLYKLTIEEKHWTKYL